MPFIASSESLLFQLPDAAKRPLSELSTTCSYVAPSAGSQPETPTVAAAKTDSKITTKRLLKLRLPLQKSNEMLSFGNIIGSETKKL